MADLSVNAKIESFAKANLKELKAEEKKSGTVWGKQQVLEYMLKKGKATQADWNEFCNAGGIQDSWAQKHSGFGPKQTSYLSQFEIDSTGILAGGGKISKIGTPVVASERQNAMNKDARRNKAVSDVLYNTLKQARDIIADYLNNPDIKNKIAQNGHFVAEQFGMGKSAESVLRKLDDMLLVATELKQSNTHNKQFAEKFENLTGLYYNKAAAEAFSQITEQKAVSDNLGISNLTQNPKKYTEAFTALFGSEIADIVKDTAKFVQDRKDNALKDAVGTALGYFAAAYLAAEVAPAALGAAAKVGTATAQAAAVSNSAKLAGVAALASCNKNISVSSSVQLIANIDTGTQQIIDAIHQLWQEQKNGNDINKQFYQNIMLKFDQLLAFKGTVEEYADKFNDFLMMIQDLLVQIKGNQEQSHIDNKQLLGDIISVLTSLLASTNLTSEQIEQLKFILQGISSDVSELKEYVKIALGQIGKLVELNQAQNTKLETIVKQNEDLKDVLLNIYAKLDKMDTDMKGHFTNIVKAIVANGAKIDDLRKILEVINNNVVDGNAKAQENAKAILTLLEGLNFTVVEGFDKILEAVIAGNLKLDNIKSAIERIEALIKKYGDKGVELGNLIFGLLGEIGSNMDLKLNQLMGLLEQMDVNNENRTKAIIEAIEKLGGDMIVQFTNIQKAINEGHKGIESLLTLILANQATMIKDNKEGFKAVIDAINNLSLNPTDFSKIEELLKAILGGVNNNGALLTKITQQNDIVIGILQSFKPMIESIDNSSKEAKMILNIINGKLDDLINKPGCQCKLDFEKLMEMLEKILKAIKDHDVHVTVDGEGNQCCCCGDDKPHEGVIGDLEDLLG